MEVAPIWSAYTEVRSKDRNCPLDPVDRSAIIQHYYPLVFRVAGAVARKLSQAVDYEDLVSYGSVGLIRAVDRFNPAQGVSFETVAAAHIRGAIGDAIRLNDWAPRSVRRQARDVEEADAHLSRKFGRHPSPEEVAEFLGITVTEVCAAQHEANFTKVRSLDETYEDDDSPYLVVADPKDETTDAQLLWRKAELYLRCASPQEQVITVLVHVEGLSVADAGRVMGISLSVAEELHRAAVCGLRSFLATEVLEGVGSAA